MKRVEVLSDEDEGESLLLEGVVNGHVVMCEMDTGAETCMIPERLAGGLQKTGMTACKPVGTSFAADSVIVRVKVGCIDREVTAVVTPDSFISNPLIGRNVGIDDLLVCAGMARALQKTGTQVEAHAVKTRAQSKKEAKAEQQAEVTRSAGNPVIRKPEEVEQVVIQTVVRAETRPEVTSPNPGEAAGEPEAVVDVTPTLDENGEPLAVVNESIDADVNVGLVIPSMEFGASLGDEYKGAMENDETLKDWKCWGSARKNGFLWDSGVLKRILEDEMSGSRELVVIPVGLRQRMLALVHDYLGHVGSGKMVWALKQSCCWPGLSGDAKRYGKACVECQRMRKGGPAEAPGGDAHP